VIAKIYLTNRHVLSAFGFTFELKIPTSRFTSDTREGATKTQRYAWYCVRAKLSQNQDR
jgi:hypothetical protein